MFKDKEEGSTNGDTDSQSGTANIMPESGQLAFTTDGRFLATTGDELLDLLGYTAPVTGVDFNPDGRYLATSSPDGTARKWDASSGEEVAVYHSPGGPLFDVKITPDGKRIIVSRAGYIWLCFRF